MEGKLVELRNTESRMLADLKGTQEPLTVEEISRKTDLAHAAVMRTALSLQTKNLVKIVEETRTRISLNEEGISYAKKGLPERRVLKALLAMGGEAPVESALKAASIEKRFSAIVLGWLSRKGWASVDKKSQRLRSDLEHLPPQGPDENLLSFLENNEKAVLEELELELRKNVSVLKGRRILSVNQETTRKISLTDKGLNLVQKGIQIVEEINRLTPELIASGKWTETKLSRYNIKAPVAITWPGKKHPYMRFLDELKAQLVALGFKEMKGPIVELSFFNCDGLYMPQDHPAREVHDMFLVKNPEYGSLEKYARYLEQVKATHEDGWRTGSKGWKYSFSDLMAARLMLRSHTTSVSVRTLVSNRLEIPGKYFAVARCYRPEVVDRTHLTEFNQVEGIIVDEGLNLQNLLGVLARFATDIAGANKVRFRPDYFPFTEPSVELSAYKEGYGWMEFGGSGIFRPEVTLPLGIKVPVLAWGLGVDRLFMMKTGIDDIRYLFTQNLEWIRRKEIV